MNLILVVLEENWEMSLAYTLGKEKDIEAQTLKMLHASHQTSVFRAMPLPHGSLM